jgi:GMP synthase (glutamine-hydrolysing)
MKRRILCVVHDDGPKDDRAFGFLAAAGHEIAWACPAEGEALPPVTDGFDAAIVYGGVQSANDGEKHDYIRRELEWIGDWVALAKPYLGLCLGSQLLARSQGGKVGPHPEGLHERGFVEIHPTEAGAALLDRPLHVYQAHYEGFDVPEGGELLFAGGTYPHQGVRFGRNAFGFQFHPECTPTMMVRWMDLDGDKLMKPGVHSRERQMADSARYDAPMAAWFTAFLDRWIADEF